MIKTLVPALLLGVATAGLAQDPAKPAAPAAGETRAPRIAVVDLEYVWKNSLLGKRLVTQLQGQQNEINSLGTKKNAELTKMGADIKAMEEELQKQSSVLSPEVVEKRTRDINKKKRDAQDYLEEGQQELDRMRQALQELETRLKSDFLQKVTPHVERVAKDRKIDILLANQAVVTPASPEFDISVDVVVKVDDDEKAGRNKDVAAPAKPADKPAAPKPATPTPSPSPKP